MSQAKAWDREYKEKKLISGHDKPQADVLRFAKWYKKNRESINTLRVLDLGSGTGRNSNYFASLGADVTGYEISKRACRESILRAKKLGLGTKFEIRSIGDKFPLPDNSVDIILDYLSSNSLNGSERENYLNETARVLRPNSLFFIKALLLDGDKNARILLQESPGREDSTYFLKELGIYERVFSESEFVALYGRKYKIELLERQTKYIPMNNQLYKRRFLMAYLSLKK